MNELKLSLCKEDLIQIQFKIMREREKPMYFNATPIIFNNARILRRNMTYYENLLWERLKNKQINGLHFRRQHPIERFIADFYCHEVRLVIELDGEIHNQQEEYDDGRTAEMEKYDIKTIRFNNQEVETKTDKVIEQIREVVKERLKTPNWNL
jgi:very-short-patch-repair endonuclease